MTASALLFDFGETLARVHPYSEWLYVRACREFGVEVDLALVGPGQEFGWEAYKTPEGPAHPEMSVNQAQFALYKTAIIAERLLRMQVSGPVDAIAARVLELDTQPGMYRVYDDVLPTLRGLRERGFRMAIISNHEWELPELVVGLGLADYFTAVVTSARAGYRKPHPRIFQAALEALKAKPEDTLMVGDGLGPDIGGALRQGMKAVLLDRRQRHPEAPAETVVIKNLTSLLELLYT